MIGIGLGTAIGGLAGIASQALNSISAKKNTDMTNKANRELAEYSYSKDLEMWNKSNEYNLPSSQMARLKEAGLNPNLIYGSGGATTQAATMPKYNAPTMNYNYRPVVDPLAMIGAYQDFQVRNAQTDNLRAQTMATQEKARGEKLLNDVLDNTKDARLWGRVAQENTRTNQWNKSGWETKRAELDYKYQKNRYQPEQAQSLELQNQLRQKQLDFFDWGKWTEILTKFGVKLPSFRK